MTPSLLLLFISAFLASCAPSPPEPKLELLPAGFNRLPDNENNRIEEGFIAFRRSCERIAKKDPQSMMGEGMLQAPARIWQEVCARAQGLHPLYAQQFFNENFIPFLATNRGDPEGLFTGYYEPLLYGSRKKHGRYRIPVYPVPDNMPKGGPYLTHKQITLSPESAIAKPIAWVDDDVGLFFTQIQGSAQLRLVPERKTTRIGYAGKNGHAYTAIGKTLLARGALTKGNVSMQAIKRWLWDHSWAAKEIMWSNESYVFFKENPGDGPIGAQGAVLTPGYSLAVDPAFIPLGTPIWLEATLPAPQNTPLHHLLIAQDKGGAIKGPVRGDIFFGAGADAETLAGHMKSKGRYWLLLPKELAARVQGQEK